MSLPCSLNCWDFDSSSNCFSPVILFTPWALRWSAPYSWLQRLSNVPAIVRATSSKTRNPSRAYNRERNSNTTCRDKHPYTISIIMGRGRGACLNHKLLKKCVLNFKWCNKKPCMDYNNYYRWVKSACFKCHGLSEISIITAIIYSYIPTIYSSMWVTWTHKNEQNVYL